MPPPVEDLDGIITPIGLFFERHHAGVPEIDAAEHRLVPHGLVRNTLVFSLACGNSRCSLSHIWTGGCPNGGDTNAFDYQMERQHTMNGNQISAKVSGRGFR